MRLEFIAYIKGVRLNRTPQGGKAFYFAWIPYYKKWPFFTFRMAVLPGIIKNNGVQRVADDCIGQRPLQLEQCQEKKRIAAA